MKRLNAGFAAALAVVVATGSQLAFGRAAEAQTSIDGARGVAFDRLEDTGAQLEKFDFATLALVAGEMGFTVSVLVAPESYPIVVLADERGGRILLQPMVCTGNELFGDTCDAVLMTAVLRGFPGTSLAGVNGYNNIQYFSRAQLVPRANGGDIAVLSRFLIAEYGIAKGNLGIEIITFRNATRNFVRYMSEVRLSEAVGDTVGGNGLLDGLSSMGTLPAPLAGADVPSLVETLEKMHILDDYTTEAGDLAAPN